MSGALSEDPILDGVNTSSGLNLNGHEMARGQQSRNTDQQIPGGTEAQEVPIVSQGDQWASEYRAMQESQRRRTRLQHTTAVVSILAIALIIALLGAVGLAVRFAVCGAFAYGLVLVFLGIVEQWGRVDGGKG